MNPMVELVWVMGLGLLLLLLLGVPIAMTLGILSVIGMLMLDVNIVILAQRFIAGTQSFTLLAIPGFILAGDIMRVGGLSRRLIRIASALVGHLTGGLSMATVFAGTFFGAISGSAPATTAAIGGITIDELEKKGYPRTYGAALATAIGPIGQMIPPSIPMVIWGVLSEQSIARLFLAGVVPGLLVAVGYIIVGYFSARKYGAGRDTRASLREIGVALKDGFWALMAPVVILGGIYGGVFTPTEASMVGVVYGLIVGLFIYRELQWRTLFKVTMESMRTTANVMLIIALAAPFAWLLAFEGVPRMLAQQILSLSDNPILILLFINLLLLILGALMDNIAAMIILSTVLIGIGNQLGIHPTQLGAMIVINFAIGMVTPPIGYSLFVGSAVSGISIERISRHLWPFFLVLFIVLMLVTFVPAVTLFVPELISR
jgi:tripartite ATP-independent transporter DctM subunit